MMLRELSLLLDATPSKASPEQYAVAVVIDNCLSKRTTANRAISLQHLRELYALDPAVPLFRALRALWPDHETSRPVLALLLALARDPLLRTTAPAILAVPAGDELIRRPIRDALVAAVRERLNESTLEKVVRNAVSSWTQAGHLRGWSRKIRQSVTATPAATAFALLMAYGTGRRGQRLFESPWAAVLDADPAELMDSALAARRLGLLDLKQSGAIVDVSFPGLVDTRNPDLANGTH